MHKFLDNSVVWFIIYFLLIVVHECVPKSSCKQISNQVVCGSMIFLPVLNYYGLNLLDHLYMHCAVLMFIFYSWTPYKQQRGLFPTLGSSWPKHFCGVFLCYQTNVLTITFVSHERLCAFMYRYIYLHAWTCTHNIKRSH